MTALKASIHAAFHRPESRVYRVVQGVVWALIGLSAALLLSEALLPEPWPLGRALDRAVLWIFVVEIALRILSFHPPALDLLRYSPLGRLRIHLTGRLRYALRPLMLFDILAVTALVPALRGLRMLRLLRLARVRWLFRYANPFEGIERAFLDNRLLYAFAFSVLGSLVLLGGMSFYLVEKGASVPVDSSAVTTAESEAPTPSVQSVGDGIWWALVTVTTVGFGDITPATWQGKVVGSVLMVGGLFTLALFAGVVSNTLLRAVLSIREEQFRMSGILDHVVICGYDIGARMLLDSLRAELSLEHTPVVIFAQGERPGDLPSSFMWVDGDPTKESELDKVRLTHARAVIVVGSRRTSPQSADALTLLTVFTIRSYLARSGVHSRRQRDLYVVAEILDAENVEHARAAGADEVIETTRLGFALIAHAISTPGSGAIMSRVASAGAHSLFLGEVAATEGAPVPFGVLARRLKESRGVLLLGVRDRATGRDRLNPPDDFPVTGDSQIIYLAEQPLDPSAPSQAEG